MNMVIAVEAELDNVRYDSQCPFHHFPLQILQLHPSPQILQLPQNFYLADTTWGKLLQVKYLQFKLFGELAFLASALYCPKITN